MYFTRILTNNFFFAYIKNFFTWTIHDGRMYQASGNRGLESSFHNDDLSIQHI